MTKRADCGGRCPLNEPAAKTARELAEAYDKLLAGALALEKARTAPKFMRQRAWQRAERAGRALDALFAGWEQGGCPALCLDCAWQETERGLAIIGALTPCSQWFVPELTGGGPRKK